MPEIFAAPDVAEIGARLIAQHHPHLAQAHILYLFTSATRKRCNRVVLGTAQRLSNLQRFLSRRDEDDQDSAADFIILVTYAEWGRLTDVQRVALVDHELCHCSMRERTDGSPEWRLRGHDVEEFAEIIQRHGLWRSDLAALGDAVAEQLSLLAADGQVL